jgi:hypothetical protein
MFGSDFPHVSVAGVEYFTSRLDALKLPSSGADGINRKGALALLPGFKREAPPIEDVRLIKHQRVSS